MNIHAMYFLMLNMARLRGWLEVYNSGMERRVLADRSCSNMPRIITQREVKRVFNMAREMDSKRDVPV